MSSRTEERPIVRGRRERPRDRLPMNDTGLESQPGRFSHAMWACILFVSSEGMFFGALFTTYFFLRARVPEWEPIFQRCAAECEKHDHDHCKLCAQMCRECAADCRVAAESIQ